MATVKKLTRSQVARAQGDGVFRFIVLVDEQFDFGELVFSAERDSVIVAGKGASCVKRLGLAAVVFDEHLGIGVAQDSFHLRENSCKEYANSEAKEFPCYSGNGSQKWDSAAF
ncbi:MAG TPA: hypothetical protein VK850_06930 [Candidatus Binatia bacterium]|nr:hypothetical protein [Candidatus Binatia bacterium]